MRIEIATFAQGVHENSDGSVDVLGIGRAPFAGDSSNLVVVVSVAFDSDECEGTKSFDLDFFDPDLKPIFRETSLGFNIAPNLEDGSCGLMWVSLPIVNWPTSGVYTARLSLNDKPLTDILTHAQRKLRPTVPAI